MSQAKSPYRTPTLDLHDDVVAATRCACVKNIEFDLTPRDPWGSIASGV